jgi:hypothetical protein
MAAFAARYATAFLEVVTAASLDTAAIDRATGRFSGHLGRQRRVARVLRESGHSRGAEGGVSG